MEKINKQILDVYLQNQLVGELHSDNATLSFVYSAAYLKKKSAVKLSAALPLKECIFEHQVTHAFFSGLLPDDDVRRRLARYLGLSQENIFALLKAIGGECAGAVSVYPHNVVPDLKSAATYRILTDVELNDILYSLDKKPLLAGEKNIRISGAGAQDKLVIAFVDGRIAIPTNNTPSTHIIKPAIKDLKDPVHNEYFCMKLAKSLNLPTPKVEIYWLENKPYYLVERYDRVSDNNGVVMRLHQEDFCQVLHIPPEMKYESEGGPTLKQIFTILDERISLGLMNKKNKILLLEGIIFNFMIGNGDAHAKNFSFLYKEQQEDLAPFYDLMSTVIYTEEFKAKMAMKISGKYKFKEVRMQHFASLAESLGFAPDFITYKIQQIAQDLIVNAEKLSLDLNSSVQTASPIYEKIIAVIKKHKQQLLLDNNQISLSTD